MFKPAPFEAATGLVVKENVPGSMVTTIKIGGNIRYLIDLSSTEEICRAVRYFYSNKIDYKILGAGSNLLISDQGVAEPVLRLGGELLKIQVSDQHVLVGGGASIMRASRDMIAHSLSGLEYFAGIPGTFGGAVRINAGAHGWDFSSVVESAIVVNEYGLPEKMLNSDFKFSYRGTVLRPGQIVAEVTLKLKPDDPETISLRRANSFQFRRETQPLHLPSFGSTFKNPSGIAAGFYMEKAGLKGVVRGGAQVSELHANWIVNPNRQATAKDVECLIKFCQDMVFSKFRIRIDTEVFRW